MLEINFDSFEELESRRTEEKWTNEEMNLTLNEK